LETHLINWAFFFDCAKAGKSIAARIAMMAITTNSSISVNALFGWAILFLMVAHLNVEDDRVARWLLPHLFEDVATYAFLAGMDAFENVEPSFRQGMPRLLFLSSPRTFNAGSNCKTAADCE
jgi:hypothetical protein